ncbi:hypothetical protein LTR05_008562 [Lithohypha guttulata]|uniref:Amino acid permease n=1 Tax=Lithohypha guttulata TaxID=1690604 RepID=A0AAN7PJM6_9EURO|nr:hypothetical protein LTR05_008562 [Lithohypha guttulata]
MIIVMDENYLAKTWHSFLLAVAAIVIAYVGNAYGSQAMPYWQNALFVVHMMAFFAFIVPIWVNAPLATHEQVWNEFEASGGWSSMGLTIMVGQLTGIANQLGVDSAAHMAEEVREASISVPEAMISIYLINFVALLPTVITVCYHMPNVDDALNDGTGYPALYVFRQAATPTWTIVLLAVIAFIFIASNITYLAAVTRDLFAFSRDHGLPFSAWISKIDGRRHVPINATILSSGVALLLALIYLGSTVAFYAIIALYTAALLQCYCFSIGCVLWRRIFHPETLPPARFSLGRFGIPLNGFAVLFSGYCLFWSFWPQEYPVTVENFNWAIVIFGIVMIIALAYFVFRARHKYVGPVSTVEGRKERRE